MLPWKSIIVLDHKQNRPLYLQIADRIISEIINGRISRGMQLPGSRILSELLSLNRKTVQQSYDELMAQGWIDLIPSKGTFIKNTLPEIKARKLSTSVENIYKNEITIPDKSYGHIINEGTPDYRLTPIELLYKTAQSIVKSGIRKSVLIGNHSKGELILRQTMCSYLSDSRAIQCSTDHIMVSRGSQMSIFLTFSCLLSRGDQVIVGEYNYHTANKTIEAIGGQLIKVPVNDEGLDIESIEKALVQTRIKAIYVTPHHHYPTTVTMPIANRLRLLELAQKHQFHIIEDDYDYDYHYNGSPILPMASIDAQDRVIYIGSFSKIFSPSIRMGYMVANSGLIDQCAQLRLLIDRRGDPVLERALAYLIQENEIQRSLKKAISQYRDRRDLLCKLLSNGLGDQIEFQKPEGGMAVWVKFKNTRVVDLIENCKKHDLLLQVDLYHDPHVCRLGFASMNPDEINRNVNILIQATRN